MKTKINYISLTVVCLMATINLAAQANLEVTIRNIREAKGVIRIALFTNEEDFLKKVELRKVVKAEGKEITVIFENLNPGDYAVSAIHDENENGELDSNIVGIPKEGFAFGNNAMGTFGPPSFDKAKVTLEKNDEKQIVDLKYL